MFLVSLKSFTKIEIDKVWCLPLFVFRFFFYIFALPSGWLGSFFQQNKIEPVNLFINRKCSGLIFTENEAKVCLISIFHLFRSVFFALWKKFFGYMLKLVFRRLDFDFS